MGLPQHDIFPVVPHAANLPYLVPDFDVPVFGVVMVKVRMMMVLVPMVASTTDVALD